jgi:hypothetical protein
VGTNRYYAIVEMELPANLIDDVQDAIRAACFKQGGCNIHVVVIPEHAAELIVDPSTAATTQTQED